MKSAEVMFRAYSDGFDYSAILKKGVPKHCENLNCGLVLKKSSEDSSGNSWICLDAGGKPRFVCVWCRLQQLEQFASELGSQLYAARAGKPELGEKTTRCPRYIRSALSRTGLHMFRRQAYRSWRQWIDLRSN